MCLKIGWGFRVSGSRLTNEPETRNSNFGTTSRLCREAGFSLVSAIFLLVVLSALGAFMVSFSGVQHASASRDVLGTRAYQAARSGIEWAAHQALTPVFPAACPATTNLTGLAGTLSPFTVTVQCNRTLATEGAILNNVAVYSITADACNQPNGAGACPNASPGEDYVARQLQATFTAGPP